MEDRNSYKGPDTPGIRVAKENAENARPMLYFYDGGNVKKITDKMRVDWLSARPDGSGPILTHDERGFSAWRDDTTVGFGRSRFLRPAIDAAIKSERRGREGIEVTDEKEALKYFDGVRIRPVTSATETPAPDVILFGKTLADAYIVLKARLSQLEAELKERDKKAHDWIGHLEGVEAALAASQAEVDNLKIHIEGLESTLDAERKQLYDAKAEVAARDRAIAEKDEALRQYGRHDFMCLCGKDRGAKCSCGLDKALAQTPSSESPKP